jgi:serine protease Do
MNSIYKSSRYFIFMLWAAAIFSQAAFARDLPNFVPLVEKNSAAVVNISTTSKRPVHGSEDFNIPENSPFHDFLKKFFGDQMPNQGDGKGGPYEEYSSLGSGFIISSDGYIITNNHVIKDADQIIVRMNDRREFVAKVLGSDDRSDIAVLRIDAKDLPTVELGESKNLKVGEWVLAIGSPFGFDYSVTSGIISAIGRSLPNENYVPFIQTDAAINPGNSGGPLFDMDGKVIGVNSQIYSRTGGFMGLSFAVPIDVVKNVYHQLRESGHVSRGWLGVLIQDVTRELAESFGMKQPRGALVAKVLPDSPADKAGFKVGDIITSFNDKDVTYSSDLPPMVGNTPVGSKVPVKVLRQGQRKTLEVTIAELPEQAQMAGGQGNGQPGTVAGNALNIVVENPTADQRSQLGLEQGQGVLVTHISEGPASKAGIRQGDVILLMNNEKVTDVKKFDEIMDGLPKGKSIPVLIQRRGNPIFLALKLEKDGG